MAAIGLQPEEEYILKSGLRRVSNIRYEEYVTMSVCIDAGILDLGSNTGIWSGDEQV